MHVLGDDILTIGAQKKLSFRLSDKCGKLILGNIEGGGELRQGESSCTLWITVRLDGGR